jgi:iron complex outermembrane receptor protein
MRKLSRPLCMLSCALSTCAVDAMEIEPTELSIEELMRVKIISVSKKPEPWFEAPAAVYVITGDNIRRSGVTSIAEALRMAPGVDVARNDAATWAVGVRGFTDVFNSKLLVLIDGRTVNSPFAGGVEWDVRDTPLEDIDRIEVIRGPGGTLWGNNAVNGVINIITKGARDTQGLLVSAGGGDFERAFGTLRYGGRIDDETFFRVYAKYFKREDFLLPNGDEAHDGWNMLRGGFRADWERAAANLFTVEGDIYSGEERAVTPVPILTPPFGQVLSNNNVLAGGHLLGRWTHTLADNSETRLQIYYDRTERDHDNFSETRDTVDIDSQYRFRLGLRQEIICGLGYRLQHDEIGSTFAASFDPDSRTMNLFNVYAQDEIELVKNRLSLTVGTKVEHNDFTGFEIEPSVRMKWTPTANQTVWAAVSRAVSTPARGPHDNRINVQAFPTDSTVALVSIFGNPDLQSEAVLAYELGYRLQPHPRLWFDVATFYNVYEHLLSVEPGEPRPEDSHLLIPFTTDDKLDGESYGAEVAARWQAAAW